jgi:hypothetical protein
MEKVIWVGFVLTVIAFILDGILWSFVFNKGMEHLMSMCKEDATKAMGKLMGTSGAAQLLFGYGFAFLWALLSSALSIKGIGGGLLFGLAVWVPTVGYSSVANIIWYGKSKPLASATAWTALLKYLVAGAVLSFLI